LAKGNDVVFHPGNGKKYLEKRKKIGMKKMRKILSVALVICMLLTIGVMQALAADTDADASDEELAAAVDELIAAIQIQEWTDDTPEMCAAAKAAWDALTPAQKELVEEADYFGRNTGNAKKDNPRNADGIGENELLVVSFGTSFNESRSLDIKGIEDALQKAFPKWSVRRAFTAQIIINHVLARDGVQIDNVEQALERAVANGVKNLVIQPTHLMHGAEYDELMDVVAKYEDKFESVAVAEPLLGEVGAEADEINADKEAVAEAVVAAAVKEGKFKTMEQAAEQGVAFVFMGHGTSHTAKISYSQMQAQMEALGYDNVFIGTVEGEPEDTACEVIIDKVAEAGYTKVILRPLMVVAGDHANNDMADPEDEESWYSMFTASEKFESVDCQIAGLGRIPAIQAMYVAHADAVINPPVEKEPLADGVYSVKFVTDSSMFRVNEALDGRGVLTVENGVMTLHVSLTSKNIVNLFVGLAEDAQKDGAQLLEPTTDTVTYSDGSTEEVYGFDIPVPGVDEDFDCALLGTKGKWYDHTVSVSDPLPLEA